MIAIAQQVDDVAVATTSHLYKDYFKFMLRYLFEKAEIWTNPLKNVMEPKQDLEFNGYGISLSGGDMKV